MITTLIKKIKRKDVTAEEMNLKEEIIQSLPRVCPIVSVENYRFKSDEIWKEHIEEINYRIDYFNAEFVMKGLDDMHDEAFEDLQCIPNLNEECVILNAAFGVFNNRIIEIHDNDKEHIKRNIPKKYLEPELKSAEEKRFAFYRIIDPIKCWIINIDFYPMIETMDEKEFLYAFNNSLLKYAKKKLALEKKNDLDTRNSQWERSVRELVHWFSDYNLKPTIDSESKTDSNDALWAIADDMRDRKDEGEFETYRDAYRWAAVNMTCKGKPITFIKLEKVYYKAKSEGKL